MAASMFAIKKKTPYCGVCFKAGKPKSEYTNHWTRASPDSNSEVTCPTILNTICRYCKEKGHSLKYCKILKERGKTKQGQKARYKEEDYPEFKNSSLSYKDLSDNDGYLKVTPELGTTWATIAKKKRLSLIPPELCDGYKEHEEEPKLHVSIPRISNWGDCSDDESEYEYDYRSDISRPCTPIELPY
jgi:hypothetical protein